MALFFCQPLADLAVTSVVLAMKLQSLAKIGEKGHVMLRSSEGRSHAVDSPGVGVQLVGRRPCTPRWVQDGREAFG